MNKVKNPAANAAITLTNSAKAEYRRAFFSFANRSTIAAANCRKKERTTMLSITRGKKYSGNE